MYILGLGDGNDSMTIVNVNVTIRTGIAKNYYHDSGHLVMSMCIWHCLASTYPQPREKKCEDYKECF